MTTTDRNWIESQFKDLRKEVVMVRVDIATLKVKATVWGLCGGAIPVAIGLGVYMVTKLVGG